MFPIRNLRVKKSYNIRTFSIFTRAMLDKKVNTLEFSEDEKTAIYTTHLPFVAGRAGLLALETVPQLSEMSSNIVSKSKNSGWPKIVLIVRKEYSTFPVMRAQHVKIFPAFYTYMKPNCLVATHVYIRDVGQKSFNMKHKFYSTDGTLLAENIRSLVMCDFNFKPADIPPPAAAVLNLVASHSDRVIIPKPYSQKSDNSFATHFKVRASDLDTLYHVNQAKYVTFILDAAVTAAKNGVYSNLRQDIAFGFVDEISVNYDRELLLDDKVKIETWQDKEIPLKICFEISSCSNISCQASILLSEPLLNLSPAVKNMFPRAQEF